MSDETAGPAAPAPDHVPTLTGPFDMLPFDPADIAEAARQANAAPAPADPVIVQLAAHEARLQHIEQRLQQLFPREFPFYAR